jgi:DNA polymerase III subunit delta
MPVRPVDLAKQLEAGLAPIYLISGDETLLVQECCGAVIDRARALGYAEREIVEVDKGHDWGTLREQTGSLSLFSTRRLFDLRVPAGALGQASDALRDWVARPIPDTVILIRCDRLDPRQRDSAWFKAIDRAGVVVLVWPISADELPAWLDQRCRRAGLRLDAQALGYLAARVEGNLLAAVQEIEKLRLQDLPSPVTAEALRAAVVDASHYDSFDAIDAALAQQSQRLRHIVQMLRAEGVAPLAFLGAVIGQIHRLQTPAGRLPPQRARIVERARARLSDHDLEEVLRLGIAVDQQVKGMRDGDPWRTLETMLLLLAGERKVRNLTRHWEGLRRF